MSPGPGYDAVSLDLWFTSLTYVAGDELAWREARRRVLHELLGGPPPERLDRAIAEVRNRLSGSEGTDNVDPGRLVTEIARAVGVTVGVDPELAARLYSDAGLDLKPPRINPELAALLGGLKRRHLPVVCITNTGRRASSWTRFLQDRFGVAFDEIVTSCEIGKRKPDPAIFHEAARRLSLPPHRIVHVGDRWGLDVEGARAAGFQPVLYCGLWSRYPPDLLPDVERSRAAAEQVPVIERLTDLLEGSPGPISP